MIEISTLADDGLIGTEVTVGGDPATRAIKKRNAFKLTVDNTVFVDGVDGDDANGLRERPDKPFKTLTAAEAAASANDTIEVLAATYDEAGLGTKDLVWNFQKGAAVVYTGGGSTPIFNKSSGSIAIKGFGSFTTNSASVFSFLAAGASDIVTIEADYVECTSAVDPSYALLFLTTSGSITANVKRLVSTTVTSALTAQGGRIYVELGAVTYVGTATAISVTTGPRVVIKGDLTAATSDGITAVSGATSTIVDLYGSHTFNSATKHNIVVGTSGGGTTVGVIVNVYGLVSNAGGRCVNVYNGGATLNLRRVIGLFSSQFAITINSSNTAVTTIRSNRLTGAGISLTGTGYADIDIDEVSIPSATFIQNFGLNVTVNAGFISAFTALYQDSGALIARVGKVNVTSQAVSIAGGSSDIQISGVDASGGGNGAYYSGTLNGSHFLHASDLPGATSALYVDLEGSGYDVNVLVDNAITSAGTAVYTASCPVNVRAHRIDGRLVCGYQSSANVTVDTIENSRIVVGESAVLVLDANTVTSPVSVEGATCSATIRNANMTVTTEPPLQVTSATGALKVDSVNVSGGAQPAYRGAASSSFYARSSELLSSSGTVADGLGMAWFYGSYANGIVAATVSTQVNGLTVDGAVV